MRQPSNRMTSAGSDGMQGLWRKFRKMQVLLRVPAFRSALRHGVAASVEHRHVVAVEDFATLIDIGANRGQFSLLATGFKPGLQVFAFEPQSAAAALFERVFANNKAVRLERVAIGPRAATLNINVAAKNDSSSLLEFGAIAGAFEGTEQVGHETVTVAPLAHFIAPADIKRPCLCKIDVQGYEMEVIRACDAIIEFLDLFYIECSSIELYKSQPTVDDIIREMASRGFGIKRIGHVSGNRHEPGVIFDILFARHPA
jgi:FkbM family methyltransferase